MPTIRVIAIDIYKTHPYFHRFEKLTALEKIAYIRDRIDKLMQNYSGTEFANDSIVFFFREYAITDLNSATFPIP